MTKKKKRNITIDDVAKKAGVSKTAVSFVLNGTGNIGEETKFRVLKAVKELNYIPNSAARSLRSGQSKRIAIVAYQISSQFLHQLIHGFELKFYGLEDKQYSIDYYSTENSDKKKNEILKELLYAKKADGVVVISVKPTKAIEKEYHASGVPMLLIENVSEISSSISIDNYSGSKQAVEHLISKGRKKIGIVSPWFGLEDDGFVSNIRRKAYLDTLKENNLECREENQWVITQLIKEEGYEIADKIIESGVDGLFVSAGDFATIGILERFKEKGIKVPEDISIVGYDNMFYSSLISPALTTVNQPIKEVGAKAFDIIFDQIKNSSNQIETVVFQPELIVRESS